MALKVWLSDTCKRYFPKSAAEAKKTLSMDYALNERMSFQVLLRQDGGPQKVTVSAIGPEGWDVRVRRIGYVPVRHANTGAENIPAKKLAQEVDLGDGLPGYVPDPLFDETGIILPQNETHGFWITVKAPAKVVAGTYPVVVTIQPERDKKQKVTFKAILHDVKLAPRKDFHITHWFYADSLVAQYKVKAFSEEFWPICEEYVKDYVAHGLDTLYVPAFTPPLDGVKLPTQLLGVKRKGKKYVFDWTNVRRWLEMAKKCGITNFEWVHPFTQWGVKNAIRIYEGQQEDEKLLFPPETEATSPEYREFLTQFFTELYDLLKAEKLLTKSFFHVSDEPHGDEHRANYQAARKMLKEIAPWMKTMDALSEIAYGREKITDMPVPSIRTAVQFYNEGITSWCYYCCGPRGGYVQRLMDTPLPKIWMHGFLFYRWPFKGFLHWGFNYWFESQTRNLIDVYAEQDGLRWPGWAYGDTCQVYPGPNGKPVDSIRWEVFGESLQDYQLLQTLGVSRDDEIFAPIKDFNDFPKDAKWRLKIRKQLLK